MKNIINSKTQSSDGAYLFFSRKMKIAGAEFK